MATERLITDPLNPDPSGFIRTREKVNQGWSHRAPHPHAGQIAALKRENQSLKDAHAESQGRLAALEERLAALEGAENVVPKKKTKKG